MFTTLVSFLVAFVFVFGGAGATAYAAQDSAPTGLLYPVKIMTEDAQLSLARDISSEIDLLLEFNNRRADEITDLISSDLPVPPKVTERLQAQVAYALRLAADLEDEEGMQDVLTKIQANIRLQEQVMTKLQTNMPEHADPLMATLRNTLQHQNRVADDALEDPLAFKERFQQRSQFKWGVPELLDNPIESEAAVEILTEELPEEGPYQTGEGYGPGVETGAGPEYGPGPDGDAEPQYGPGPGAGPGPEEAGFGPGPNEDSGQKEDSGSGNNKEGAKEAAPTSGAPKKRP